MVAFYNVRLTLVSMYHYFVSMYQCSKDPVISLASLLICQVIVA